MNRIARLAAASVLALLMSGLAGSALAAPPVGPPYPRPETDRAVYDFAEVFSADTIAAAEATIDAIEARTGVEIAVYSQVTGYKPAYQETEDRARALMDEWGVGQRGIDNGLVIFFDLDFSKLHGQVSLYAGSGFKARYLSDDDRQRIFDESMLPRLRDGDLDGALRAALVRIDNAATPESAQALLLARQINAIIGIVGGGITLVGLLGWAFLAWRRSGRDPVVATSESMLMPAPPTGMTPAVATLILDGEVSRRTLTTALLDLASRGRIAFREKKGPFGIGRKLAIDVGRKARVAATADVAADEADRSAGADDIRLDAIARARLELADRGVLGDAEAYVRRELGLIAEDESIEPEDITELASAVPTFETKIENQAVHGQWFAVRPSKVTGRWRGIGAVEAVGGGALIVAGFAIPMSGLTLLGGALLIAGIVTIIIAEWMPARTASGALQRSWLLAYRRTLEKTMEQARSMDQVVAEAKLDWLDTPDRAVVWAMALGLGAAVEDVLGRTMEDTRSAGLRSGYLPGWYIGSNGTSLANGAASGGGGIFSGSGLPDIGGMMSTLGTIGNAPSSSGSGGDGGGFGGGGGGGGGGAGGGF